MPRPHKRKRVCAEPKYYLFKPAGIQIKKGEVIQLRLDELEAMRLANLEGLYQEQGAERMNTSRATFGRILDEARKKVTEALIEGKAIQIGGGNVDICETVEVDCEKCGKKIQVPCCETVACPSCGSPLKQTSMICGKHHGCEFSRDDAQAKTGEDTSDGE